MKTEYDALSRLLAVLLPAVLILRIPSHAAESPTAPEPIELKTLRMEYQQRLIKAQTPADDWYRMQLRTLLKRYKQTGNLDASVTAQAEMETPDPSKPPPADKPLPPELAGIRNSYVVNAQRLRQPVEGWYRQQLVLLERSLVQRGDIAGAGVVRQMHSTAAGSKAPARQNPPEWVAPAGGRLREEAGVTVLRGPGNLADGGAVALLKRDLPLDFVVTGRLTLTGTSGGFVIGSDDKARGFVAFTSGAGPWSGLFHHSGEGRSALTQALAFVWPRQTWTKFEVRRRGASLRVEVGDARIEVKLPATLGPGCFGILTYLGDGEMSVKDVVVR